MLTTQDEVGKKVVFWRARLQPFSSAVVKFWTALSFQQSVAAGLVAYLSAFIIFLGFTLLDGSAVYQLGLLMLMTALCYALFTAGLKSHSLGLVHLHVPDENAVIGEICVHLARVHCLISAAINDIITLRIQRPIMFYMSGMMLVFILGRLGQWLSLSTLLCITATVLLIMPATLSRQWITVPTTEDVRRFAHDITIIVQTNLSKLIPSSLNTLTPAQ